MENLQKGEVILEDGRILTREIVQRIKNDPIIRETQNRKMEAFKTNRPVFVKKENGVFAHYTKEFNQYISNLDELQKQRFEQIINFYKPIKTI